MTGIPIKGKAKGSAGAAFTVAKRRGAIRLDFTRDYFVSLYAVCATLDIRADVLVAQWSEETGDGTSTYWTRDGNPAGLAAFDDGSNWGLTFTPETAAGAQAVHMARYLGMTVSASLQALDARWQAVADAGYVGKVKTTADLGNGLWATNPSYSKNLLERYTAYWGEPEGDTTVSDTVDTIVDILRDKAVLTFGKVPMPGYIDRQAATANKPEGIGWDNLGRRTPMFIVLHRMLGTLNSTDNYFPQRATQALTDYGIGTANVDGASGDGKIIQWNDPRGYRAGWSSGPVSAPYGDALKWIQWSGNKWGVSICNVAGVSIEHSGQYNDAMTDFAFNEDAKLVAYWLDQIGVHWDKAPFHPVTGISAVTWHQEWTIGTGKICPGQWLMNNTDRLIKAAAVIMKQYQTGTTTPSVPAPKPPVIPVPTPKYDTPDPIAALAAIDTNDNDTAQATVTWEGLKFVYVGDRVRALRDTPRLRYADPENGNVGPDLKKGDECDVMWRFTSHDDNDYFYSPFHTRLIAADFERVSDVPSYANNG